MNRDNIMLAHTCMFAFYWAVFGQPKSLYSGSEGVESAWIGIWMMVYIHGKV